MSKMNVGVLGASDRRGSSILVLDDDRSVRDLVAEILAGVASSVVTVETVEGARKLLREGSFDLLVFDLNLPDGMSSTLATEIRAGTLPLVRRDVPILLTSTVSSDEVKPLLTLFSAFISKPWRIEQLRGIAQELLAGQVK